MPGNDGDAPRKRTKRNENALLVDENGTKITARHILRAFGVENTLKKLLPSLEERLQTTKEPDSATVRDMDKLEAVLSEVYCVHCFQRTKQ